MRGDTMTYTGTLKTEECCACHIMFAMPADLMARARADSGVSFYCPLGHSQHYTETDVQRLERELKRTKQHLKNTQAARDAAWDQAQAAERSRAAVAGHLTRARKRIAAGVCPECHRTFPALEAHMATEHPGYADKPPEGPETWVSDQTVRAWAARRNIPFNPRGRVATAVRVRYELEHQGATT